MTTLFYEDQFIQLAPQIRENSLTNDPGKGSPLLVELDGDNYGDAGIDLDGDGRDDLAIWRPYDSPYGYGWYSENPQYTFKSGDNSLNGKYYKRVNLSREQSFSIESINEIAEEHDSQISRQAAYTDISQTWDQFISFQGRHYPRSLLNQAGVHWIFIDEGSSLIKFAIDPENFKLYYSSKTELSTVKSNNEPSNISLSQDRFNENILISSTAATLSTTDPGDGDTFTYSLVDGDGDADNNAFTIVGDELKIKASPDYETKNSYSVRLRTKDSGGLSFEKVFTLSVNDLNEDPINLLLSASSFEENIADASTIAILSSTDPDSSDTHTYSLVDGDGDTDNNAFTIVGDELKIKASPDYEIQDSYSVRLRTTDSGGLSFDKAFTFAVNDLEEESKQFDTTAPTVSKIYLEYDAELIGFNIKAIVSDELSGIKQVWGSIERPDGVSTTFGMDLNDETNEYEYFWQLDQYSSPGVWNFTRITTEDNANNYESITDLSTIEVEGSLTIPEKEISDNNASPTNLLVSASTFDENITAGSAVATLSSIDPDSSDTFTYSLIDANGDTDNSAFTIDGDQLKINDSPDFETKDSYSVRLRTTDSGDLTFEKSFTLSVNDLNELTPDTDAPVPQSLELSASKVDLSNGDSTIDATVRLTDDLSGIGDDNSLNAEIRWRSPSGQQFVDASFYAYSSGNDNDATFNNSYPITFNTNAETGIWSIEYFRVVDEAGNGKWFYPDELKELDIETTIEVVGSTGAGDTTPPVPQSLELSTTKVDLSNGDFTISATTHLTDDLSGIGDDNSLNAEIRWRSPSGQQFVDASFYANSSGNDNDATFNNSYPITFNANAETGIWNIEYFRVVDEVGNGKWFYPDELKGLGIETTIEVVNSTNSFNAPTDLNLTTLSFSENISGGFAVASFITSDADLEDYHDYKLVRGDGDADNSAFIVDGEQLKILASPDFETKSSYSIRLQTNDSAGLTFEKSFKLNVNNPADIQIIQSMDDASTQDHVTTFKFQEPIVIHRQSINFLIVGTIENDGLMGNSSSEVLAGGQGRDILTGGIGADAFLFQENDGFGGKKADVITDFYPKDGDFIFVEQEVFGLDKEIRLKSLSSKKKVKKSAKTIDDFIYHKKKGLLYFNENGKEKGWGDGGLFAKLQGAPELGVDDFRIV